MYVLIIFYICSGSSCAAPHAATAATCGPTAPGQLPEACGDAAAEECPGASA